MGFFGKLEHWVGDRIGNGPSINGLKSSIKGTAKLGGTVAPLVSIANPLLGAGLAAAGGAARGKSLADIVKEAGISAGVGYGLNHLGDAVHGVKGFFSDGAEAAGSVAPGAIASAAPSAMNIDGEIFGGAPSAAAAAANTAAPGTKGFWGSISPETKLKAAGQGAMGVASVIGQSGANAVSRDRVNLERQQYEDQKRRDEEDRAHRAQVGQLLSQWFVQRSPGGLG